MEKLGDVHDSYVVLEDDQVEISEDCRRRSDSSYSGILVRGRDTSRLPMNSMRCCAGRRETRIEDCGEIGS